MGQAKARGTFEERKAQAVARQDAELLERLAHNNEQARMSAARHVVNQQIRQHRGKSRLPMLAVALGVYAAMGVKP